MTQVFFPPTGPPPPSSTVFLDPDMWKTPRFLSWCLWLVNPFSLVKISSRFESVRIDAKTQAPHRVKPWLRLPYDPRRAAYFENPRLGISVSYRRSMMVMEGFLCILLWVIPKVR